MKINVNVFDMFMGTECFGLKTRNNYYPRGAKDTRRNAHEIPKAIA